MFMLEYVITTEQLGHTQIIREAIVPRYLGGYPC